MKAVASDEPEPQRPGRTAAKVAGVSSCALLSLLMNPLFVAPVVALAALLAGPARNRSPRDGSPPG